MVSHQLGIKSALSGAFSSTGIVDDFGRLVPTNSQTFWNLLEVNALIDAERWAMWSHRLSFKLN